jgi:hypothetical protein
MKPGGAAYSRDVLAIASDGFVLRGPHHRRQGR